MSTFWFLFLRLQLCVTSSRTFDTSSRGWWNSKTVRQTANLIEYTLKPVASCDQCACCIMCLAEQMFWEVMQLRREMSLAKLGYYKDQLWQSNGPAVKPRPSHVLCPAPPNVSELSVRETYWNPAMIKDWLWDTLTFLKTIKLVKRWR